MAIEVHLPHGQCGYDECLGYFEISAWETLKVAVVADMWWLHWLYDTVMRQSAIDCDWHAVEVVVGEETVCSRPRCSWT